MIFIIAIAFVAVNSFYWIFVFSALSFYRQNRRKDPGAEKLTERSAVIIPVRTESDISATCIRSFAEQYPLAHELLIVDDHAGIDNNFQDLFYDHDIYRKREFPVFRLIKNEYRQGKKYALSYGIERTDREFMVFTDADCYAASNNWLVKILAPFKNENIDIVLGYSPYISRNWLGLFVRFETFMTALQYFSYALRGMPYMGVGRNLAFRKRLFLKNKGYDSHLDLLSGSDDLFVRETANSGNVAIQIDPDSFVFTYPKESLPGFIRQKTRHVSTSFRYSWKHKILLSLYAFSHIGSYAAMVSMLLMGEIKAGIILMTLRFAIILISTYASFIKLGEKKLLYRFPILDFLMTPYYIIIPFFYLIYDKKRWK